MRRVGSKRAGRLVITVASAVTIGLAVPLQTAVADTDDLSETVAVEFLSALGIDAGATTVTRLAVLLVEAVDSGAVNDETIGEVGLSATTATTTMTDREQLRERLRRRAQEQVRRWQVLAPEWRDAFGPLRERLRSCRENGGEQCLNEVCAELRYRWAERFESTFRSRVETANGDPTMRNQLAELERARERAENMLRAMLGNGDADVLAGQGVTEREMERLRDRLREHAGLVSTTTVPGSTASTTATGGTSSGPPAAPGSTERKGSE